MSDELAYGEQSFKIGARILDRNGLKMLLPNYKEIANQINQFRKKAERINEAAANKENKNLREYYHNTFSILGDRGTGKTSILYTLRYLLSGGKFADLRKDAEVNEDKANPFNYVKNDIILPVIVPGNMSQAGDVLGWIINYLEAEKESVNQDYKNYLSDNPSRDSDYFRYCRKNKETELTKKYRKLQKAYLFRQEEYTELIKDEFVGIKEYIEDNEEILQADQKLIQYLKKFINQLLDYIRTINDKEPLLFIFFDDVDISANRGSEVLSVIRRYFSNHPNIIVFVTGEYSLFSEMLTINLLKEDGILGYEDKNFTVKNETEINDNFRKKDWKNTWEADVKETNEFSQIEIDNALNRRIQRSQDYLKKILPPALRYDMLSLDNKDKVNFKHTALNKNYKLINVIEKAFNINKENSFLRYKGEIIYPYFKIFDEAPRGVINVYKYLFDKYSKEGDTEERWTASSLKHLLEIVLNSSTKLSDYKSDIEKIIKIESSEGEINYYVDYELIDRLFKSCSKKNRDDFINLFILAHFFENILILNTDKKNVHGSEVLVKILNSINSNNKLYPNIKDTKFLLYFHYLLADNIMKQNMRHLFSSENTPSYFVRSYFKQLENISKLKQMSKLELELNNDFSLLWKLFRKLFKEDEDWVKKQVDFIFKYGKENKSIYRDKKEEFLFLLKKAKILPIPVARPAKRVNKNAKTTGSI
jgi:hypothetical protein